MGLISCKSIPGHRIPHTLAFQHSLPTDEADRNGRFPLQPSWFAIRSRHSAGVMLRNARSIKFPDAPWSCGYSFAAHEKSDAEKYKPEPQSSHQTGPL